MATSERRVVQAVVTEVVKSIREAWPVVRDGKPDDPAVRKAVETVAHAFAQAWNHACDRAREGHRARPTLSRAVIGDVLRAGAKMASIDPDRFVAAVEAVE